METTPNKRLFFFFLLLLLLLCHLSLAERCHHDDENALLQIKAAFHNASPFATWTPHTDCCKGWRLVSCKKLPKTQIHRVNFLEIDGSDEIVGEIPSAVGNLPYLETLIFRLLPNLTGPINPAIGQLVNLNLLFLNWDDLTGPIPGFLSRLPNLGSLSLNNNRFTGSIPASLGRLPKLQGLDLSQNRLTGSIPTSFGSFGPNFQLTLSENRLSGPIPRSLGAVNFEAIELAGNRLTGDASFLFGENKSELTHLVLSRNRLSFDLTHIVLPVGQLNSSLLIFDVSHNRIYGQLPAWLGEAPFVYQFDVSYNRLCGPIPVAGGKLQGFDVSSFSHNKCLCGAPLPPCKSSN